MEDKDFIFNEETKEITFKIYNNPYDEDKPLFNLPNESLTIKPSDGLFKESIEFAYTNLLENCTGKYISVI